MKTRKIAVCIPWDSQFMWMQTAFHLMNLNRPKDVDVKFFHGEGRDPAARHMWSVNRGVEWGATHICILGADQLYPMDILEKFCVQIEKGWDGVCAAVPSRGKSKDIEKAFPKLAWKMKDPAQLNPGWFPTLDEVELVDPADGPYQEIIFVGTGALMFDATLLDVLRKPWFKEMQSDENGVRPGGMDTSFVGRLVIQAHARLVCDLTIEIQHLGVFA